MLGESVFLLLIVLPIAVCLALFIRPYAEELFRTKLHIIHSNLVSYILIYLLLTLVIGLFSGLYTSTYLSRLNVIGILKNNTSGKGKPVLRSVLITVQLVIFCSFISGTLIIRLQYKYALNKDLGYQSNNILLVDMGNNSKDYKAFIHSVNSFPEVKSTAGAMDALPALNSQIGGIPNFQDPSKVVKMEGLFVDYNFIETMGIKVLTGRSFSEKFGSDLNNSVLINEKAVKDLGIEEPLGKQIEGRTIIGVINDFNLHTIRTDIPPMFIIMTDKYIEQAAINYMPDKLDVLLPKIEKEWKAIAPDRPFQYETIEDVIKGIYESEKNLNVIVSISALFSLLIAAFGLFGLTLFIAKTRTKEIGIKKVFGSSEKSIVYSFLKSNALLVIIASLLSVPVTMYFMTSWLNGFSYHTTIAWWVFAMAFAVAASIVLLTVLYHSWRASRINPVEALRYE